MGRIRNVSTGEQRVLEPEFLVGRSRRCDLYLDDPSVSSEHALFRAAEDGWVIKDLGSLNRTFAGDVELRAGEPVAIAVGMQIVFGHEQQTWEVLDIDPPQPMAVPREGGEPVLAIGGLLALPSGHEVATTLQREPSGAWVAESDNGVQPVGDRDEIEIAGVHYRLVLPRSVSSTLPLTGLSGRRVADLQLTFRTSRDLEHIELDVSYGSAARTLGARSHNEMLLVLARAMQRDSGMGLPPSAAGWTSVDDLCRGAAVEPSRLNVDIYRVRRQFAELGVVDPAHIIERRPRAQLVRLGTQHIAERAI